MTVPSATAEAGVFIGFGFPAPTMPPYYGYPGSFVGGGFGPHPYWHHAFVRRGFHHPVHRRFVRHGFNHRDRDDHHWRWGDAPLRKKADGMGVRDSYTLRWRALLFGFVGACALTLALVDCERYQAYPPYSAVRQPSLPYGYPSGYPAYVYTPWYGWDYGPFGYDYAYPFGFGVGFEFDNDFVRDRERAERRTQMHNHEFHAGRAFRAMHAAPPAAGVNNTGHWGAGAAGAGVATGGGLHAGGAPSGGLSGGSSGAASAGSHAGGGATWR